MFRAGLFLLIALLPAQLLAQSSSAANGYVFGVTVSSLEQLDIVLDRATELQQQFDPDQHGKIAVVLHGRELEFFQKNGDAFNSELVDRARLLDSQQVIDIKACQTQMRSLEIGLDELPDFIEQVPLAPVEIQRLVEEQGFTRL